MSQDKPQLPVSKFQRIQAFFAANPKAAIADAVAALKQEGLDISPRYVSQIKSKSKPNASTSPARKRRKKRTTSPPTETVAALVAPAPATPMSQVSAEAVVLAIQFMRSVGGSESAKAALTAAEQVEKALRQSAHSSP